jgi:MtfA peptidase
MWFIYTIVGLQVFFWVLKLVDRYSPFKPITLELLPKIDPWYDKMTDKDKRRFRTRYNDFIRTTKFIIKEGVPLDKRDFVKAVIGLSAARLSMFLSRKAFDQYEKIVIYPEAYYSTIGRAYHKGEVNPGMGFIVFSFEAIVQGLEKREGVNLLYHELAHALWLEHKLFDYDVFKDKLLDSFETMAKQELQHAGEEGHHFFRSYGYTNLAEFFAVATENFFERPQEFKQAVPDLYFALAKVYKQEYTD